MSIVPVTLFAHRVSHSTSGSTHMNSSVGTSDAAGTVRPALEHSGGPVVTTAAEATRALEVVMPPDPFCVAQTRCIAAALLRLWEIADTLAEDVRVVISELVTNAIKHGHGIVSLRMRHCEDELRIEVTDGSPAPAELNHPDEEDESGRGVYLVAVLASGWGVSHQGRTTWATFHAP
ncbi:ATP-binding protein [Streptomyces sp. NEAU-Y11]|uniref:ATP-binding protein n=1 Tax=Streptomyces cucumeris TaxID=2962890 RepID=UPI0020C89240|nr:ATP-binding protein [Streptomyces sp. NEAU-Y11]MCP9206893.1 ATP-binding protein [Streptomyces sp. NEAU-Y11]